MTRNHALDSLRGLAALAVALGHCNLACTGLSVWQATVFDLAHLPPEHIAARFLYLLFPQDSAVTVFFVLSGHVLWQSFSRAVEPGRSRSPMASLLDFADYVLSRSYRLLPTLAAACLIMAVLAQAPVSVLVRNMFLVDHDLIGVSWTLQVEFVCSIALFVVYRLTRGSTRATVGCLIVLVCVGGFFKGSNFFLFFPAFLLGALVDAVPQRFWRASTGIAGLVLLSAGSLVLGRHAPERVAETIGAFAVIGTVGTLRPAFLLGPKLLFLGAISYPFYLAHPLGMAVAQPVLSRLGTHGLAMTFVAFAAVSIGFAAPVAWLLHIGVERPMMLFRPRLRVRPDVPARSRPIGLESAERGPPRPD